MFLVEAVRGRCKPKKEAWSMLQGAKVEWTMVHMMRETDETTLPSRRSILVSEPTRSTDQTITSSNFKSNLTTSFQRC